MRRHDLQTLPHRMPSSIRTTDGILYILVLPISEYETRRIRNPGRIIRSSWVSELEQYCIGSKGDSMKVRAEIIESPASCHHRLEENGKYGCGYWRSYAGARDRPCPDPDVFPEYPYCPLNVVEVAEDVNQRID